MYVVEMVWSWLRQENHVRIFQTVIGKKKKEIEYIF